MNRIIIGLVGNPGSGKSTIARYLAEEHGFYYFEGSDGIRQHAEEEDVDLVTREDYSNFHRSLQQKYGKDVLAKRLLKHPDNKLVYAGLRSVANAQKLQSSGAVIIVLRCPVDIRFERIDRSGLKYEENLSAFTAAEKAELYSPDGYGADVARVMELVDIELDTSKSLAETLSEIDRLVDDLGS